MNHSVSTSEGGLALLDQQLGRDAFVVDRARKAGVVIIGHANLAENADHRGKLTRLLRLAPSWTGAELLLPLQQRLTFLRRTQPVEDKRETPTTSLKLLLDPRR